MICTRHSWRGVPPRELLGGDSCEIEEHGRPVPHAASHHPFPVPAAAGGAQLLRNYENGAAFPLDPSHQVHILHQGHLPVSADEAKVVAHDEDRRRITGFSGEGDRVSDKTPVDLTPPSPHRSSGQVSSSPCPFQGIWRRLRSQSSKYWLKGESPKT